MPEPRPPTRRRTLISAWGFLVAAVIWLPLSIWNLTQGERIGASGGLVGGVACLWLAVYQFRLLRKTPAQV